LKKSGREKMEDKLIMKDRAKRIIPSKTAEVAAKSRILMPSNKSEISRISDTQTIMEDAKAIVAKELYTMKANSFNSSQAMDVKQARALNQLVDSLIKLSREERELTKNDDLGGKTDEELMEDIRQLMTEVDERK
jgi:uncharacterized protein YhaN